MQPAARWTLRLLIVGLMAQGKLLLIQGRGPALQETFRRYNQFIRPVENVSDPVTVEFEVSISQLVKVDEVNQIMETNLWLRHIWNDYKLRWMPREFDGIEFIRVPSNKIWRPDIVLYNNTYTTAGKVARQVGGGSLNCLEFGDSKFSSVDGCTGKKCSCPCQHGKETPDTPDLGKITRQLSPTSISTVVAFSVLSPEVKQAIESVKYIAENMRSRNKAKEVEDDWKYVAMVIDRIFLWVFVTVCVLGTVGLFLQPLCGFVS
ncbi:Neuronal acetylcholine receptor subunit alpha-3 [Dissostichus eleginoides]|uniref:Neuronal acetylcholine receptor subunit alpha-3 n=1 Tax=Dissostichus eleginoides TaxID=100907 RepID=A0AAD9BMJ9_DISEL|nr:Neuronal acetylcholine receptor subunit alpha-3 [Dissostichus eleginoides]